MERERCNGGTTVHFLRLCPDHDDQVSRRTSTVLTRRRQAMSKSNNTTGVDTDFYPGSKLRIMDTLTEFMHDEISGSVILLVATIAAMLLANSPLSHEYFEFWEMEIVFSLGAFEIHQSLLHFIDDGLMALFFLIIGLEIKREVLVGELASLRQALLPFFAAIGGMIIPAGLYVIVNLNSPGASGWGVPIATDIAFALGILALLGSRIPVSLKIFLTALAIVDDLGSILIIAIFYSSELNYVALGIAFLLLLGLFIANRMDVQRSWVYATVGFFVWAAFLSSGVHATLAGVLVALTIPARSKLKPIEFVEESYSKLKAIVSMDNPGEAVIKNDDQQEVAREIKHAAHFMQAPLQRIEHSLHPVATFLILPLFALANAGVALDGGLLNTLLTPVGIGVMLGLIIGKQLGITTATYAAVKLGVASLPQGVTWKHIYGVSWLAGVGFTMALFISNLAFRDSALLASAKSGVLAASVIAGVVGYVFLMVTTDPIDAGETMLGTAAPAAGD